MLLNNIKNVYLLKQSSQAGFYACLITAKNEKEALRIAKEKYFSFTHNLVGNTIEKLNINKDNFISLIEFDDLTYEG